MNQPGHQQNWQSSGWYDPRHGFPEPDADPFARQGSKALVVFAAVLGLGLAGVLTWQALGLWAKLGGAGGVARIWIIAEFVVAGIVVLGVVLVLARRLTGAFVLGGGALVALLGLLLAPVAVPPITALLAAPSSSGYVPASRARGYRDYLSAAFETGNELAILQLAGVVLAFLVPAAVSFRAARDWLRR